MTVMPEQIADAVALRYRPGTSGTMSLSLPVSRDSTFGRAGDGAPVLSQLTRGSVGRAGGAPLGFSVCAGEDSFDATL